MKAARVCSGQSRRGLQGQPGVDTSLESLSCAIEGDRLAAWEVHSVAEDTSAAGHEVFICDRALAEKRGSPHVVPQG